MFKTPGPYTDDAAGARSRAALRALLAFVVFPNLLFLALGLFFFTNRSFINLDYIALGGAWLWLPPWLRVTLFAALFIFDAVGSTAGMYNIHVFTGVVALFDAPVGLIITVAFGLAVALGLAFAIGYFAFRFLSDTRRRYLLLAPMAGVGVLALVLGASSSTVRFARDLRDRAQSATPETFPVEAASDSLRAAVRGNRLNGENVLVVNVESMGALRDSVLRAFVWAPMRQPVIEQRYRARTGLVHFRGGTTSGELRELCGIFADYITVPSAAFAACLPRELARKGYRVSAVHGYMPAYYDRFRWYPALFDSVLFDADLARTTPGNRCGTQFRGICDRDAIVAVERLLRAGDHRFVYWMTLDAHTPIDIARMSEFREQWQAGGLDGVAACGRAPDICLQGLFWRDMLRRLATLASDSTLPPMRVLIVGDHAPAFVRRDRAEEYVYAKVPFLELIPRNRPARSGTTQ
jgi:phosphoglycerol transferase MdoB-like AlkP superfamily enzyme